MNSVVPHVALLHRSVILLVLLLSGSEHTNAQSSQLPMAEFARRSDSLLMNDYEKRDAAGYRKHLAAFEKRYARMSSDDKRDWRGQLANSYYNAACTYALVNDRANAAIAFRRAVDEGFSDYAHAVEDSDLDSIRREPQFEATMARLKSAYDYLFVLRNAATYDNTDIRSLPAFTYQQASDSELVAIRKYFRLDSIAGQGNVQTQAINIMHWVHYLVPHDGNHPNPSVRNALSLVAQCRNEKRGLNCRGLATVLNECYLALGIPARIVTCLPKDSMKTDPDCHVINAVYSSASKKWLWMDPTNDAYVMNEKGELLSIPEVRERLVSNETLILNPDANWNRQAITRQHYLYEYMAKNLYMLESPVNSRFDLETKAAGKSIGYVQLLPVEGYRHAGGRTVDHDEKSGTDYVRYITTSDAAFWKEP